MSEPADPTTTIATLRQLVAEFVAERNWRQFHTPKNLSMALAVEAAELMEHFQWLSPEEARAVAANPAAKSAVGEELADIFCYVLAMANELELDVATALRDKMVKNRLKYPIEGFRGRYGPDDPRPVER
ncbi:MAG: nucleotide pyrophosphohydrolase [Pirellulales bacterium]|nr:nucleotide pyrophosphohydrolase [Pirellulales bacterium]